MKPKTIHLSRGLSVMTIDKDNFLCWQPNDFDHVAHEMWKAHTEEKLHQIIRERLATKGD